MLSNPHRSLTKAAIEVATAVNDDGDHTVGAALMTKTGEIVTGVNAFHFLGGPCAEITALANHAAANQDDPVVAVTAAYGPTAEVLAPCGKCRQVLFDLNPSIACIVRTANGYAAVPVHELLPYAYDWRAVESGPQLLYMWEGYEEKIRSGAKRQTIRIDDPFREGPAEVVFEKTSGEVTTISAVITEVRTVKRSDLVELDAQRDGFGTLADLHSALDRHYPGLADDNTVDLVAFEVSDDQI